MSSSDLFARLTAANPDGLWLLDAQGGTLYANDAMRRLLGIEPEAPGELDMLDFLDDQGRADFVRHMADAKAGMPGQQNIEALFYRVDGTAVWTLVSWAAVAEPEGSPTVSWLHRITEYTDRRELTETLRLREQQLSTAQAIGHFGSWEWDIPGDSLVWSEELCRIYQVDPAQQPTYQLFLDFFHPQDVCRVQELVEAAFRGEVDEFEWEARIILADQAERWVRGRGRAQRSDGQLQSMSGTAQDITEIKSSVNQARWANQRLRAHLAFTEASNQAASLAQAVEYSVVHNSVDSGWKPVGMFEQADADAPIRRTPLDLTLGPGLHFEPGLTSRALAGQDLALAEAAWRTGELQVVPIPWGNGTGALTAVPVMGDNAVVAVVEALIEDHEGALVSPELIGQISRQFNNVALREQAATQLARARDEAMAASALKSDFLATMSHEIRTPMNGVIGLNELLLDTDLDHRQRHLSEGLRESGLTLLGIINDILDLSKIESGKLELDSHGFDVRAVVEQAAALQATAAAEKGLELVVSVDPGVPSSLVGDSGRFGQILSNLCSNAVKFTDVGEVDLRVSLAEADDALRLLRVTVTDTGIGIPLGGRKTLFEPFTQADPSTTRRHGGTGLGLTICQRLVTALGGEIGIEDHVGPGSRFWFTARFRLPAPSGATHEKGLLQQPGVARHSVLLIEDNQRAATAICEMLHGWGLVAHVASSAHAGAEAMRTAAHNRTPYDVVLVDQTLPDGGTVSLTPDLSDWGHLGPVVLLGTPPTSWRPTEAPDRVVVQVSKPVRTAALRDALTRVWGVGEAQTQRPGEPTPDHVGVVVLVVEDNPVNQIVATGFLEALGCRVEIADNGVEALAALSDGHKVELVLMDCRMPRMDGYDATRAIRRHEADRADDEHVRVPIVAMTASVLAGERERCLAAGMDDFLTKPVGAAAIGRVLDLWAPVARGVPAISGGGEPPRVPSLVLDTERARDLAALVKDGVSFYDRTRISFTSRVDALVRQIRVAVRSGDAEASVMAAHALKGSAENIGLVRLGLLAGAIETTADQGDVPGDIDATFDALEQAVTEAVSALNAFRVDDHA